MGENFVIYPKVESFGCLIGQLESLKAGDFCNEDPSRCHIFAVEGP